MREVWNLNALQVKKLSYGTLVTLKCQEHAPPSRGRQNPIAEIQGTTIQIAVPHPPRASNPECPNLDRVNKSGIGAFLWFPSSHVFVKYFDSLKRKATEANVDAIKKRSKHSLDSQRVPDLDQDPPAPA